MGLQRYSYVNGVYAPYAHARLHIEDRATLFADSVYEGINLVNGQLLDYQPHIDRLYHSLSVLNMSPAMSERALLVVIRNVIRKNKARNGFLYVQVSRGTAPRNHLFPKKDSHSSLVVTLHRDKAPSSKLLESGVGIVTRPDIRWGRCDAKTTCLLPNVLAKQSACEEKAHEAVMLKEGYITEGSSSNHFIVDGAGVLRTHPATHAILGGIVRGRVLELAREIGMAVSEEAYTLQELYGAKESFLTSTTMGVMPVVQVDGALVGDGTPGEVTLKLLAAYQKFVGQHCP